MSTLEHYQSGHWQKDYTGYSCFMPSHINSPWRWYNPNLLLEQAAIQLGELNSLYQSRKQTS